MILLDTLVLKSLDTTSHLSSEIVRHGLEIVRHSLEIVRHQRKEEKEKRTGLCRANLICQHSKLNGKQTS